MITGLLIDSGSFQAIILLLDIIRYSFNQHFLNYKLEYYYIYDDTSGYNIILTSVFINYIHLVLYYINNIMTLCNVHCAMMHQTDQSAPVI